MLWAGWAFLFEARDAASGREQDPFLYPSAWLLGGPQPELLRDLLDRVDRRLPRGASVAVSSHAWSRDQLHYLTMWTAYYLPHHVVVHRESRPGGVTAEYLLMIPPAPAPEGAERIELGALGEHGEIARLFRLRR